MDFATGNMVVTIAAPLEISGELAVVLADITIDSLIDMVKNVSQDKNIQTFLLAADAVLLLLLIVLLNFVVSVLLKPLGELKKFVKEKVIGTANCRYEKLEVKEIGYLINELENRALADVFDALVNKRCYKEAYSCEKAYEIIEESLGTHFDPNLGRIFLTCKDELERFYGSMA